MFDRNLYQKYMEHVEHIKLYGINEPIFIQKWRKYGIWNPEICISNNSVRNMVTVISK